MLRERRTSFSKAVQLNFRCACCDIAECDLHCFGTWVLRHRVLAIWLKSTGCTSTAVMTMSLSQAQAYQHSLSHQAVALAVSHAGTLHCEQHHLAGWVSAMLPPRSKPALSPQTGPIRAKTPHLAPTGVASAHHSTTPSRRGQEATGKAKCRSDLRMDQWKFRYGTSCLLPITVHYVDRPVHFSKSHNLRHR